MTLSTKAKESIKTSLAMAIAYGIALGLNWDKPMWAGLGCQCEGLVNFTRSYL